MLSIGMIKMIYFKDLMEKNVLIIQIVLVNSALKGFVQDSVIIFHFIN
jgi:hypothetical protein